MRKHQKNLQGGKHYQQWKEKNNREDELLEQLEVLVEGWGWRAQRLGWI